jgi:hypothetical protein
MAAEVFLHDGAQRAVLEPLAALHRNARPAHAAHAVNFLAIDRQQDFVRAGIAADQPKFHAEHVDQEDRQLAQRRPFAGVPISTSLVKASAKVLAGASELTRQR